MYSNESVNKFKRFSDEFNWIYWRILINFLINFDEIGDEFKWIWWWNSNEFIDEF